MHETICKTSLVLVVYHDLSISQKKSGYKKEHRRHAPAHKIHLPAWTPNKENGPEHHACAQNPPSEIPPKRYKNEFSTVIATTSAFRKLRTGVPPQRNPFFYPENGFCMHFYTVWRMSDFNGKTRYKIHFLSSRKNIKYTVLFQKRQGRNPLTPFPPQRNAIFDLKN